PFIVKKQTKRADGSVHGAGHKNVQVAVIIDVRGKKGRKPQLWNAAGRHRSEGGVAVVAEHDDRFGADEQQVQVIVAVEVKSGHSAKLVFGKRDAALHEAVGGIQVQPRAKQQVEPAVIIKIGPERILSGEDRAAGHEGLLTDEKHKAG